MEPRDTRAAVVGHPAREDMMHGRHTSRRAKSEQTLNAISRWPTRQAARQQASRALRLPLSCPDSLYLLCPSLFLVLICLFLFLYGLFILFFVRRQASHALHLSLSCPASLYRLECVSLPP